MADDHLTVTVPEIRAAFGPGVPFGPLSQDGQRFQRVVEGIPGGERPAFADAFRIWTASNFLFALGAGDGTVAGRSGSVPENLDTTYRFAAGEVLSADEVAFDDAIARVARSARAEPSPGLREVPLVAGMPSVPMLTMHNNDDLFVPILNQVRYAERVAANDRSDRLVQRAIRGWGHCDFDALEYIDAFDDSTDGVEDGTRPNGDDDTDTDAVAGEDFGCEYPRVEKAEGLSMRGVSVTSDC